MIRKTALTLAMLGALVSEAQALGLGQIELKSALHQPLDAEIQLIDATPAELQELRLELAPPSAFAAAGIERTIFLTRLHFQVERRPDGTAVVHVTSREPVREPYLDFLLEATWSAGQVVREYTMLVDPPGLMKSPPPRLQAPTAATAQPAPQARPRSGARYQGTEFGPTRRTDTLWRIAEQVRPDTGISMEQTMLALLRANPDAFYGNNINNLKAGYVLRVPDRAEMLRLGRRAALQEVRRQHQAWREARQQGTQASTAAKSVPPATPPAAATQADVTTGASGQPHLKLTAPDEGSEAASANGGTDQAAGGKALAAIRHDLAMAVASLETQRHQNEELSARLAELEHQVQQMQHLIELKDQQLALLQQQAARASAPATPAEAKQDPADAGAKQAKAQAGDQAVDQQPDLLARFLGDVRLQAAAGGTALLLILLGLWLRRRRTTPEHFEESILQEAGEAPQDSGAEQEVADAVAAMEASAAELAAPPQSSVTEAEDDAPQTDSSLFSDFAISDLDALPGQSEADPLVEADVFLAYGRYQQAEDVVRQAMEEAPERRELRMKLLEIYHAARNVDRFGVEAEALLAELSGTEDPAWEQVAEMGRELDPANPLYNGNGALSEPVELDEALEPPELEPLEPETGGVVADSGMDPAGTPEADGSEPEAGAETTDREIEFTPTPVEAADETLVEGPAGDGEEEVEILEFESVRLPGSEDGAEAGEAAVDVDLDAAGGKDADADVDEDSGTGPAAELDLDDAVDEEIEAALAAEPDLDDAVDEDGFLEAEDEVATKLELARAYIEMGDPEGARDILEEVLQEGSADQQTEARTLMQRIA